MKVVSVKINANKAHRMIGANSARGSKTSFERVATIKNELAYIKNKQSVYGNYEENLITMKDELGSSALVLSAQDGTYMLPKTAVTKVGTEEISLYIPREDDLETISATVYKHENILLITEVEANRLRLSL